MENGYLSLRILYLLTLRTAWAGAKQPEFQFQLVLHWGSKQEEQDMWRSTEVDQARLHPLEGVEL